MGIMNKRNIVLSLITLPLLAFSQNTFYGSNTGNDTNGTFSTYYGTYSGENSVGNANVFSGYVSGQNNQGDYNVFLGYQTGRNNQASNNTFLGYSSGRDNTTGKDNTFLGSFSGIYNTTGKSNTFLGRASGQSNVNGNDNVFIGFYSGLKNTTGNYNIFVGRSAGYTNLDKNYNTFIGHSSGTFADGSGNVFNGSYSGYGYDAAHYANLGMVRPVTNYNTFVGHTAGRYNEGNGNISLGYASGYVTKGDYNMSLGYGAGYENEVGNRNVFIGFYSGRTNLGSNNVFIGNESGRNEVGSNKLYIDNSSTATPLIYGDFATDVVNVNGKLGVGVTAPLGNLHVGDNSNAGISISNRLNTVEQMTPAQIAWGESSMGVAGDLILAPRTNISTASVRFFTNNGEDINERVRIKGNGNVGINTTNPQYTLDVKGIINTPTFLLSDNFGDLRMRRAASNDPTYRRALVPEYLESTGDSELVVNYAGDFNRGVRFQGEKVVVEGNLGIGTTIPDEKLTVNGKIHTQEVRVDLLAPMTAPDYVFEKYFTGTSKLNPSYEMPTLEEVEAFTKANNHLPEIPSAQEMKNNGIQLKEMNLKLLQKIEELTLYTIQQQKELEKLSAHALEQQDEIKVQKDKNKSLENRLAKIEVLLGASKK